MNVCFSFVPANKVNDSLFLKMPCKLNEIMLYIELF